MRQRKNKPPFNQIQLPLYPDLAIRKCIDPDHKGNKIRPADRFVKNGRCRRRVCRDCWAREQRERSRKAKELAQKKEISERGGGLVDYRNRSPTAPLVRYIHI